jgi:hypothetical protein
LNLRDFSEIPKYRFYRISDAASFFSLLFSAFSLRATVRDECPLSVTAPGASVGCDISGVDSWVSISSGASPGSLALSGCALSACAVPSSGSLISVASLPSLAIAGCRFRAITGASGRVVYAAAVPLFALTRSGLQRSGPGFRSR